MASATSFRTVAGSRALVVPDLACLADNDRGPDKHARGSTEGGPYTLLGGWGSPLLNARDGFDCLSNLPGVAPLRAGDAVLPAPLTRIYSGFRRHLLRCGAAVAAICVATPG